MNWLGGVVGYHVSLTSVSSTEGPEFKPRLSQSNRTSEFLTERASGLYILSGVVAEWLSRKTRNLVPSGASVRIWPTSFFFAAVFVGMDGTLDVGCCGAVFFGHYCIRDGSSIVLFVWIFTSPSRVKRL